MTLVGGRNGLGGVESGLLGLQDSPKGDAGRLWQPRVTGGQVHEGERSPWGDRGGLSFG